MQYGWYLLDDIKRGLIKSSVVRDIVPYGPFHVEFQPTGVDGAVMDYRRFTELVDELAAMNLTSVRFAAGAEPLAHPRAVDMVRYLAGAGVAIAEIETNAVRLDSEMIGALLEAGTHTLVSRLDDAISPEGDSLHLAVHNLRRLRDERCQRGLHLPKLTCQFSIRPDNVERVELMIGLSRELGAARTELDLAEDPPGHAAFLALDVSQMASLQTQIAFVRENTRSEFVSGSLFDRGALESYAGFLESAPQSILANSVQMAGNIGNSSVPSRWSGDHHCYIPWYHMLIDAHFDVWPAAISASFSVTSPSELLTTLANTRHVARDSIGLVVK